VGGYDTGNRLTPPGVVGPMALSGSVVNPWLRYHANDVTRAPLVDGYGFVHMACVAVDSAGSSAFDRQAECTQLGAKRRSLVALWPNPSAWQWMVVCNDTAWMLGAVPRSGESAITMTAMPAALAPVCSDAELAAVTAFLVPSAGLLVVSGPAASGTVAWALQANGSAIVQWSKPAVSAAVAYSAHAQLLVAVGPAGLRVVRASDGAAVSQVQTAAATAVAVVDPPAGNATALALIIASNGTHVRRLSMSRKGALPVGSQYRWDVALPERDCSWQADASSTGLAVDVDSGLVVVATTYTAYGSGGGVHTLRLEDGTPVSSRPPLPVGNDTWRGCLDSHGVLDVLLDRSGTAYTLEINWLGAKAAPATNLSSTTTLRFNKQGGRPCGISTYGNGSLLVAFVPADWGGSGGFGMAMPAPTVKSASNVTGNWTQLRHDSAGSGTTPAWGPDGVDGALPRRSWQAQLSLFRSPSVLIDNHGNLQAPCAIIHPSGVPLLLQTTCNWTQTTTNYLPSLFALEPDAFSASDVQSNAMCWGNLAELWQASQWDSVISTSDIFAPFTDCSMQQLVGTFDPVLQVAFLADDKQRITAVSPYTYWALGLPPGPSAPQQVLVAPDLNVVLFRYANALVAVDAARGEVLTSTDSESTAALLLPAVTAAGRSAAAQWRVLVTAARYGDLTGWRLAANGTLTPLWNVTSSFWVSRAALVAAADPTAFYVALSSQSGEGALQLMSAMDGSVKWAWQPGRTRAQPTPSTAQTYTGYPVTDAYGRTYTTLFRGTGGAAGAVVYDSATGTPLGGGLTGFTGQLSKAASLGVAGRLVVATEGGYLQVGPPIVVQA
jgi:hypothetical protein